MSDANGPLCVKFKRKTAAVRSRVSRYFQQEPQGKVCPQPGGARNPPCTSNIGRYIGLRGKGNSSPNVHRHLCRVARGSMTLRPVRFPSKHARPRARHPFKKARFGFEIPKPSRNGGRKRSLLGASVYGFLTPCSPRKKPQVATRMISSRSR